MYDVTSCLATWSDVPSGGASVPGPMFLLGGRRPLSRGVFVQGGGLCRETIRIRKAVGTHYTEMLSCFCMRFTNVQQLSTSFLHRRIDFLYFDKVMMNP